MKNLVFICAIMIFSSLLVPLYGWAGDDLIPPSRMLDAASNPNGYLSVFSEPSGQTVYLDKKKIGVTPIFSMEIEPGKHVLKIKEAETGIVISQGESKQFTLHKEVFLDITPKPDQAGVQEEKEKDESGVQKTEAARKPEKPPSDPFYWPLNPEGPIK